MSATQVEKAKLPNDQNGCLMDANNNPLEKFKTTTQITIQKPSTENKSTETNEKAKDISQLFYTGRCFLVGTLDKELILSRRPKQKNFLIGKTSIEVQSLGADFQKRHS